MKPVLYLTAYADHAPVIWKYAQDIAAQLFNNQVVAAHIYEEEASASLMTNTMDLDMAEAINDFADRQLEEQRDRLRSFLRKHQIPQLKDLKINSIIQSGDPSDEVQTLLGKRDYSLVIMGTQTRGNLEEFIFGSVAQKVIENANCPVMLVPPGATYQPLKDILFASGFVPKDLQIIDYLLDWTNAFQTKLHILHISEDETDWKESNQLIEQWKLKYDEYLRANTIEYVVGAGPVLTGILHYAKEKNCGAIVLHKRKRSLMDRWLQPSYTKMIQQKTDRPLLIFKPDFL